MHAAAIKLEMIAQIRSYQKRAEWMRNVSQGHQRKKKMKGKESERGRRKKYSIINRKKYEQSFPLVFYLQPLWRVCALLRDCIFWPHPFSIS